MEEEENKGYMVLLIFNMSLTEIAVVYGPKGLWIVFFSGLFIGK